MFRYFTIDEFRCKCGDCVNLIDHQFVKELDDLRHEYGKPMKISSGYRCPTHNAKVSSTGINGPHTFGRAADIAVDRADAHKLARLALNRGFTGVGFQQKGTGRFLHLDNLSNSAAHPRPTVWSY